MSLIYPVPQIDSPDGPMQYRFFDDFTDGFNPSTSAGIAKYRSYEQNGADTQTVQDDYLRLQTAGAAKTFHACANRGFKLQNMQPAAKVRIGAKVRVLDATDVTWYLGLSTFASSGFKGAAPTDFVGMRMVDPSATIQGLARKDSSDTLVTIGTAASDTWMRIWMEFVAEATMSSGVLSYWLNGTKIGATRVTTFPDDLFIFPCFDVDLQVASDYLDISWLVVDVPMPVYTDGTP